MTAIAPASASPVVAELAGVSKYFGRVHALDGVDLTLRAGEVHCLAGENGAGKSTLIRILTGAVRRDAGEYRMDGAPLPVSLTPVAARDAGVGVVYQELRLLPDLSVGENLLMGILPSRGGLLRRTTLRSRARAWLERVGLDDLDPATPVAELPAATRQLVEIAAALGRDARLVIFDEPTTALSGDDASALLARIGRLRDSGVAVLYITHRLEEIFEIGDRVTVLRDGQVTSSGRVGEYDEDSLIAAMVGRTVETLYPARDRTAGRPLLTVRGLRRLADSEPVDITVDSGEIVGVAGLLGSGRSELLRAVFGADPVAGGTVRVDGRTVPLAHPRASVRAGIGLMTEDRKELGLLPELTIRENASIASMPSVARHGLLRRRAESAAVDTALDRMRLRADSYDDPVSTLSGGNQQKVLLARWLVTNARVLLLDEPTKGVDVGAKGEIYDLIGDLAGQGLGIVVVSSYLPELLGLADRIVVLRAGAVVGELPASAATEEEIIRLASTGTPQVRGPSEVAQPAQRPDTTTPSQGDSDADA